MIATDEELRQKVRVLKAIGQIDKISDVAEMLNISKGSFYNWINGSFSLSDKKKFILKNIICDLAIV